VIDASNPWMKVVMTAGSIPESTSSGHSLLEHPWFCLLSVCLKWYHERSLSKVRPRSHVPVFARPGNNRPATAHLGA
jgi:hypothetical protein